MNLGANTVHFNIEKLNDFGLNRVEVCLGRSFDFDWHRKKVIREMQSANLLGVPLSVHLPIYLPISFRGDYLDAFFLDESEEMREMSFEMLELNLDKLKKYKIDYFVIHFPGVVTEEENPGTFYEKLHSSLFRINKLAEEYNVTILLEYFGSNINFRMPSDWIDEIGKYPSLGILVDLGHLYFASLQCEFDFSEALEQFLPVAKAYHLWTTNGKSAYGENSNYLKYKHIVPHVDQMVENGWAYDVEKIISLIADTGRPSIIEAAPIYNGNSYYEEGVRSVATIFQNC